MKKIFVITGQTATGKTTLAVKYAKKHNGELINADSHQIYRGLDIITGKDKREVGKIPIHLYDIVDPHEYFSSYDFKVRAERIIKDILKRGKTPIIVGGTYLYISHLLYGIGTENIGPDFKLRAQLEKKSVSQLQSVLKKLSRHEFDKLNNSDRNNSRRLIRKIEILKTKHKPQRGENKGILNQIKDLNVEMIGLRFKNKEKLVAAIRKRVKKRLKEGAIAELEALLKKGYKLTDLGLKATGCREIAEHISKKITKEQLVDI